MPEAARPQDLCHSFYDQPVRETPPELTYVICSSPRSGSTLLSHLLATTGRHGVPHEYLNPKSCMAVLARRYGLLDRGAPVPPPNEAWSAAPAAS